MTDHRPRATGSPPRPSPLPRVDDGRIAEIRQLLATLDDTRPDEMDAAFYQHGFWELDLAVRDLLRILGHDSDA